MEGGVVTYAERQARIAELRERERDFAAQVALAKEAERAARRELNRACEELVELGVRDVEFPL